MNIQPLPKGYYAILSEQANIPTSPSMGAPLHTSGAPQSHSLTTIQYKGVTYEVTEGVNLIATLAEAGDGQ